jgi:outer membrane protein
MYSGTGNYRKCLRGVKARVLALLMAICFLMGTLTIPVVAKEPAHPEISLNQAIGLALQHSEGVKKAEKEIDRTEEWRDYRGEQLGFIPTASPGSSFIEIPWAQMLTADLQWRMSKKQLTAEQDTVALDTCKKYWDILSAQEKVKSGQAALDSAMKQLQNARAGYQAGMITKSVLIGAEAKYKAAQASLEAAKNELDTGYTAFNRLVGLWPEDRPVLTDTVEFNNLEIASLDYEVTKVLEDCPTVWLAQERVTLQGYLEDMMFYTGEYSPYKARKAETEQAQLDAINTKKAFKQITRSLYYGVMSLEEGYAGALEGVRAAEENLRVVKARYDVGMATRSEISEAEQTLSDAQTRAFDLACQHAYMKLAFKKPWAYLSGMSAGGA